jgi:hypothetical protein
MGYRVQGLELWVKGLRFMVYLVALRAGIEHVGGQGRMATAPSVGLGFRVSDLGFRVYDLGFRV